MSVREDREVISQFDKDGNKRLALAERKAAREFLARKSAPRGPNNQNAEPPRAVGRPFHPEPTAWIRFNHTPYPG